MKFQAAFYRSYLFEGRVGAMNVDFCGHCCVRDSLVDLLPRLHIGKPPWHTPHSFEAPHSA